MKHNLLLFLTIFVSYTAISQTKIGGVVKDTDDKPVAFCNVIFKDSREGTITDENGKFYMESDKDYNFVEISFMGFKTKLIDLRERPNNTSLEITLREDQNALDEITIYQGNTSKENNPALDILRKIWENRRKNGVNMFDQYQYHKYEKQEFDLNTIDSSLIKSRLFKGMEFIFEKMDTSAITGKTYLPIFINESAYQVYGDNKMDKEKEVLLGNRNSGFSDNQAMISFVKDLYAEYNVYDNYLKFFDKSFVSPLSTTGIDVYNYVLADTAFIDNKKCYKIVYYPRRKNELTFKGKFWVNDSTWAIKEIDLKASKSANINWVRDIYIEQEYDVLNDSVFLITRDYFMSDFSFRKKDSARGLYGKRTTLYDNYKFDIEKGRAFYNQNKSTYHPEIYNRDKEFWENNRIEKLTEDEREVYEMLDTLKDVPAFQRIYRVGSVLASGYYEIGNFDLGPVFSIFGYNQVEGIRTRIGGRTYFDQNDPWRIEGYLAYGFKDDKFKYGISGKYLIDHENRIIIAGGNRRDVEQLGASLTNTTDVLGRSLASSSLITVGANNSLSDINLTTLSLEFSPFENFTFRFGGSYRTLEAASEEFSLAYYTNNERTETAKVTRQAELNTLLKYTPGRKTSGYGVERLTINDGDYSELFLNYSKGIKGMLDSDFDYEKLQFFYRQPFQIGGLGTLTSTLETGKTFGEVPLGLLSVVPGNQTLFSTFGSFPLLDYYEFVTDTYASLHLEHNFNGRLFGRIPLLRELNLREIVGVRGVMGDISRENRLLNASTSNTFLRAPNKKPYYSFSFGVANIFKIFRLDFHFRGNYFENPDARSFGVTGSFGFYF
jgi:hypothetical protein